MLLSEQIKNARIQKGLSQEFLAEKLGVSRQAVSKWETGLSEPTDDNLSLLFDILEIDASEFYSESSGNLSQPKLGLRLCATDAILLIASCVGQMFVFGINVGSFGTYEIMLSAISSVLMCVLLVNVWRKISLPSRHNIFIRILLFSLLYNALLIVSSYVSGFLVFAVGLTFILLLIKIQKPSRKT